MEKSSEKTAGPSPPVTADRLSELPDSVLHQILSLLPFKPTVQTSVLSKRWRNLWEHFLIHTDALDFGEEFARAQTHEQFVDTVNRYLHLHKRNKIHKFRLFFYPGTQHQVHAEKWLEFAIKRSVKELDFDFCGRTTESDDLDSERLKLLDLLYSSDSPLTHLKLGQFEFNPPLGFTGFGSLVSLYLRRVNIADNTLESVLMNCPLLSDLSLYECGGLKSIKILGPKEFQLKRLFVGNCYNACEIDVLAPNLNSFCFYGDLLSGYSFQNVSALEDVYLNSNGFECTEPEHDYIHILSSVSIIKTLTVCTGPLMHITMSEEYNPEALPVSLPNLQELQILIELPLDESYLSFLYGFFKHTVCPCLEKLFIELGDHCDTLCFPYSRGAAAEEPSSCWFYNLKTVKITNFHGVKNEMRLVKLFLSKSVSLEILLLVATQNSDLEKQIGHVKDSAATASLPTSSINAAVHDQLLILPKASNDARIVLCRDWEADSRNLSPTHTKYEGQPIPFNI